MENRFSRLVDRTQFIGVLLAVFLVPLIFYTGNQNIVLLKSLLAQSIVYFLFALWLIDALERGQFSLPDSPLNGPVVLFFLWSVATVFLSSPFWFYSLEESGRYAGMILMFFLIQRTFSTRTRLKWGLWVLFAVCVLATGYGLLQYNGVYLIQWGKDVLVSTFGNRNFFAGFLVLTTPVIFGYIFATRKWAVRVVLIVLAATQFYILNATGTRTGFLGFLTSVLIFLGLFLRFVWWRQDADTKRRQLLALLVLVVVGGTAMYYILPGHLFRRMGTAFDLQQGTGRVRWIMWTGSTRAAQDQPLVGHGHGVFQLVFPNYRPSFYHRFRVSHNTRHSHNEFLEILMETGTVGLSLFLLIFVLTGAVAYRFLRRTRDRFYRFLMMGLIASLAGFLVQNFASVNMRWMSSTIVCWFLIALVPVCVRLATDAADAPEPGERLRRSYRWLPAVSWKTSLHVAMLTFVFLVWSGFYSVVRADFALKDLQYMIRVAERSKGQAVLRANRWDQLVERYPGLDRLNSRRFSQPGRATVVALRDGWRAAAIVGESALRSNRYNLSAQYKLGYVYLSMGNYRAAGRTYSNLTDMAPNYAQIHNNIALIHLRNDEPYRSLLHFEWATWLEDNFRNHKNLMRRSLDRGLQQRGLYHALRIPLVAVEERRDLVHTSTVALGEENYGTSHNKIRDLKRAVDDLLRSYYVASDEFSRRSAPGLAAHLQTRGFLTDPLHKSTLQSLLRSSREDGSLSSMALLGLAGRLRRPGYLMERDADTLAESRQQFAQFLQERLSKRPRDPVLRLALADLMAQLGDARAAWELVEPARDSLSRSPRFRESLQFIRSGLPAS